MEDLDGGLVIRASTFRGSGGKDRVIVPVQLDMIVESDPALFPLAYGRVRPATASAPAVDGLEELSRLLPNWRITRC